MTPLTSKLSRDRRAFTKIEFVVVLAICGVLFAIVYPALQNARHPNGPYGEIYPTIPPAEDRRITHPTGLSIVAPVNWDQIRDMGPSVPFLSVACRGFPGARLKSWITIRDCKPPLADELSGLSPIQFGPYPAFEGMSVTPTNADQGLSTYDLFVETSGQWWHVTFCVAGEETTLSPSIREYIETIQFP